MTGETTTGFRYDIDEDALNDWEVLEILKDIEGDEENGIEGDTGKVVYLVRRLFDAKTIKKLKKHCTYKGKVLVATDAEGHPGMVNTVFEIIRLEGKNS